ncbi:AAA family ATPase [Paraburkholderia caribensis]|uniref:AAA family ATPase n=1 Tax=Paraburkholderia caribensis TaxID=75105 RepID=UPI000720212F|nr:AAA family ATPase [Paraburkholderia caribensis]ALP68641.1 ATP-binding protein [Paraburkholderia caribensis]AUT58001.1 ATP-binding protein [Paraburkholderia caribensis]
MKIEKLELKNVSQFESLDVDFAPQDGPLSNVTILIGINGAGKTTILRSLATALSWYVARVRSDRGSGQPIPEAVIRNGANAASTTVTLIDDSERMSWTVAKVRPGRKAELASRMEAANKLADRYRHALSSDKAESLPLIAFYSVERVVLDVPLRIRGKRTFRQLDGYDNSLSQGVDFRRFFEWFREREDFENESGITKAIDAIATNKPEDLGKLSEFIKNGNHQLDTLQTLDWKGLQELLKQAQDAFSLVNTIRKGGLDSQLAAVRTAIEAFMPGFSNLRVRRKPSLHMSVEKDGRSFNILQLSQGEKSLMALVGDIARRLAMMNPTMDNPLLGDGVVLIDEVDMHLHPQWARSIVERLTTTFPNCQFIVSTHSPLVISDCKDVLVYGLNNGSLTTIPSQYGQDANTVLLDVMDTHIRNAEVARQLNDLLDLIQDNKLADAKALLNKLRAELPQSNLELTKASLLLRKREQRAEN